jgi:hypothetical protein
MILAIDPGNTESAYVVLDDDYKIIKFDKVNNWDILAMIDDARLNGSKVEEVIIEMISSYGMPVGKEVFDTCVWIGRFMQASTCPVELIYRKDVKLHLCNSTKAKDSNVIQALKDRFGDKGTVKNKGYFYGFKADIWQAHALAVTYLDKEK